jgi:hypothetical protein
VTETFVLHLRSGPLAHGDINGVVEVVATGERHMVSAFDDLRSILTESARQPSPTSRKREGTS